MRGTLGFAVAGILLAASPVLAQVRRAAPMARPILLPNRQITYVRPARQPVPVAPPAPRVVSVRPGRPAYSRPPATFSLPPATTGSTPVYTNSGGTPIPLSQLLNQAPGLGYDFTSLAALNSDLAVRAIIDPLTQHELAIASQLPRTQPAAFFGGFGDYAAEPLVVQSPPPQVIVIQQPAAQPAPAAAPAETSAPARVSAAPPAAPLPDVGQFILVRRDGAVIHAVAFSHEGDRIIYITANGLRRSFPYDQLDVEATEARNAESGSLLQLQ